MVQVIFIFIMSRAGASRFSDCWYAWLRGDIDFTWYCRKRQDDLGITAATEFHDAPIAYSLLRTHPEQSSDTCLYFIFSILCATDEQQFDY